ncbi:MAG: tRNA guanosine(34) transglycosylase Tgt [Candidatus Pacebacteria bacterium]|nr:tRNA guanosine(34) transglycosylase Tgt [Candidatus Paceibacterota bacterium]
MKSSFEFRLEKKSGRGRTGLVTTAHGSIQTPAFMPVGTQATVKAMLPESVRATGAEIVLGNTYHLMLRPTAERVARLGGLHRFMNWPGPILTDSGGYQVMSLAGLRKITEEGVAFNSHLDGSKHLLTAESSTEIQRLLDATISMVFDECTPYPATRDQAQQSMLRSLRWAKRSRLAFDPRAGYGQFGIVQGGIYPELRLESAAAQLEMGFEGYAIGGLAVGEGQEIMFQVIDQTEPHLPQDRPRYLMGVGKPPDIVGAVMRGIDMFDCVLPTRSGRTAQAFTRFGTVNIRNARHQDSPEPLDPACSCPCCRQFSRGYLHHLTRSKEILGAMLLTWHNLHYYQELMAGLRQAIREDRLKNFAHDFSLDYGSENEDRSNPGEG